MPFQFLLIHSVSSEQQNCKGKAAIVAFIFPDSRKSMTPELIPVPSFSVPLTASDHVRLNDA